MLQRARQVFGSLLAGGWPKKPWVVRSSPDQIYLHVLTANGKQCSWWTVVFQVELKKPAYVTAFTKVQGSVTALALGSVRQIDLQGVLKLIMWILNSLHQLKIQPVSTPMQRMKWVTSRDAFNFQGRPVPRPCGTTTLGFSFMTTALKENLPS